MIEIYWVSDNGDTKSLYWAGSFIALTTADEPYIWTSKNDHSKTNSAMLASSDDNKTMTYKNGVLSYEASAMGTTTTVKLEAVRKLAEKNIITIVCILVDTLLRVNTVELVPVTKEYMAMYSHT